MLSELIIFRQFSSCLLIDFGYKRFIFYNDEIASLFFSWIKFQFNGIMTNMVN